MKATRTTPKPGGEGGLSFGGISRDTTAFKPSSASFLLCSCIQSVKLPDGQRDEHDQPVHWPLCAGGTGAHRVYGKHIGSFLSEQEAQAIKPAYFLLVWLTSIVLAHYRRYTKLIASNRYVFPASSCIQHINCLINMQGSMFNHISVHIYHLCIHLE